jgi:RHS repeat-associated protein
LSYKINYSDETQFDGPTQVQTQYTYDDNDRLTKQGGVQYEYDKNGNTTRIAEEDQVMLLHYDGNDRLIKVTTEENGQVTSTVTYAYDADGNRIQTNADGEVTQYVVDSNDSLAQVIAELDANNQVNVAYLHGDDLISQYRGNDVNYYHYDGLGSTRVLTDNSGASTDSYIYEAFGELTAQTGETENHYLFTGEQIDPNTGNYYLRARYYNPDTGGFLSMDSFDGVPQDPVTLHKYLYANGNPVNMVDPSGYFAFSLGGLSMGNTIRGILTTMNRVDKGLSILDFVTDPTGAITEKLTNKALGALVLLSRAGNQAPHLLRLFSKKARKGICPFNRKKNSFVAGTLVHTQNRLVAIEEVQIGDRVWSFNEETGEQQWNEVVHLIQRENISILFDLTIIDNQGNEFVISTTPEHPFFVPELDAYVAIEALVEGTLLQTDSETLATINSVQIRSGEFTVYNFGVKWTHNYFVSSSKGGPRVLVHNNNDENKPCLSSFVVGNRSVAEVVGNTPIKPGTQGDVDKSYVEQYALDMTKGSFDWDRMSVPMEFVKLPDGTMIIREGHHRFIAAQMTNTPIPWDNTKAVIIENRKKWPSKTNWNDYVWW